MLEWNCVAVYTMHTCEHEINSFIKYDLVYGSDAAVWIVSILHIIRVIITHITRQVDYIGNQVVADTFQ